MGKAKDKSDLLARHAGHADPEDTDPRHHARLRDRALRRAAKLDLMVALRYE